MQNRTFIPSEDSHNRLERLAYYAQQAGDLETANQLRCEFYEAQNECGTEDDCCHECAG